MHGEVVVLGTLPKTEEVCADSSIRSPLEPKSTSPAGLLGLKGNMTSHIYLKLSVPG